MEIVFEPEIGWNGDRGGVVLWAIADAAKVRCFVKREAVADFVRGPASSEAVIDAFHANRANFENELTALILSGRTSVVPNQQFREATITISRIRRRAVARPTRRIMADQIIGSVVAEHAIDIRWWSSVSGQMPASITVVLSGSKVGYVDIAFPDETAASDFDHKMSTFGVRTFRLAQAG